MKLKDEFMTHMDADTQIMIDVSAKFSGLVRSNIKLSCSVCRAFMKMIKWEIYGKA